ncbi:MAG TPA: hypothetical protein VMD31_03650 [Opitutaceae bacterium]|nr:hypothetical protein [Opitutaceae bacterium]
MEPTDLNHSSDDARLEAWLRSGNAGAQLPDDGFTARVLAALPPPSAARLAVRRRGARRRSWLLLIGTALGCAAAFSGGTAGLARGADALLPAFVTAARQLATPSLGLAAAATAASLVIAYWPDLVRRVRRLQ